MKAQALVLALALSTLSPAFAAIGGDSGGGGDASELRVNEIRSDILTWIQKNGARELVLPADISYGEYFDKMTAILENKKVALSFTNEAVKVKGVEKTCRGAFVTTKTLFSEKKTNPQILCNITRFKETAEAKQYSLIHHEYAGLVNIEKNDGSASDYEISNQITDFLKAQTVLKLAVIKKAPAKPVIDPNIYTKVCNESEFVKTHQDKLLQAIKQRALAMITDRYANNKLKPISKIAIISVKETLNDVHAEFTAKAMDITIRVDAQEDSANLMVSIYFADANLVVNGTSYDKKDALGRLLEKGAYCSVNSQRITEEGYEAPIFRNHYISFLLKNLDLEENDQGIGSYLAERMSEVHESFIVSDKTN